MRYVTEKRTVALPWVLSYWIIALFIIFPGNAVAGTEDGLSGWWLLDDAGGTVAQDLTGLHPGTLKGTNLPQWVSGKMAGALSLGGTGLVDTGADLIGTGPVTLSLWINQRSYGNGMLVTNGSLQFGLIGWDKKLYLTGNFWTNVAFSKSSSLSAGTWQLVTVTRDAAGLVNFYVNGILSGTASQSTGMPQAGSNVLLGNRSSGDMGFDGSMDDVRIYNRMLSPAEIQAIYVQGTTPDLQAPTVATNLRSTSVERLRVSLAWDPSSDDRAVKGYNIFRNGIKVGTAASVSYTDTGLNPNTTYRYTVSASDRAGNTSVLSDELAVTTLLPDTTPPTVPANLRAGNAYANLVSLFWDPSTDDTGVTGYKVFRNGTYLSTVSSASSIDLAVSPTTTYTYAVAAVDEGGNTSVWSAPLTVTTRGTPMPLIPEDRRIDWSGAGVPGGIIDRKTLCATLDPSAYGNGAQDATTAIQNALNACPAGQVVFLPEGRYRIEGRIRVPGNVTLRGAGPSKTILDAQGSGLAVVSFGLADNTPSAAYTSVPVTAGSDAGSTQLTLGNAGGITVGSYLMITQLNDPSFVTINGNEGVCTWCDGFWNGTRAMGQIVEVTAVNGNNVGITPPLYTTYAKDLSPLASPFKASAKYAGVESLQVYMNNTGYTANFLMQSTAYCWINNVESNFTDGDHARAFFSFRGEIRDSYFHDAFHHTPGGTDADVFLAYKTSGFLVENNILRRMHCSIMLNWGAAGNVVAYNYSDGTFDENATNVLMMDFSAHGAHPMFNLWEGNVAETLHPDGIWGSSSHNTAFRNWFRGTTQICDPLKGRGDAGQCWWAVQALRAVNLDSTTLYTNIIGNVVGSDDMLALKKYNGTVPMGAVSTVVSPQFRSYDSVAYAFSFGYGGSGDGGSWTGGSSRPFTTALLHGNYDYVTHAVAWDPLNINHTLPPSLYRNVEPSWWPAATPWPAIGPDVMGGNGDSQGHIYKIPAQVCYETGPGQGRSFDPEACYGHAASGDVSGDGRVTMYDAALVLKYTVGGELTTGQQAQADINHDTLIDAADAMAIAKKTLGLN